LTGTVEQGTDDLPAVLERVGIGDSNVDFEAGHVHAAHSTVGAVRGVTVPDRDEDFTADPVELFFDLVFVFAFSRLVYHLVHHPDWTGVGEFTLLFVMIWLPWTQFTWSANAVSGNARSVRGLFLIATVASVPMAGAVTDAFAPTGGLAFAVSLSIILAMGLLTMIFGLEADHAARRAIVRYSIPNYVAIALMVTGALFESQTRVGLWIAAMVVVVIGTIRAGGEEWLVRPGHFAERHGLIVIVALGEVIVALGIPIVGNLDDGTLPIETFAALVAAGTFAGLLWWSIFDRPLPALEHRHELIADPGARGRFARNVYTYAHLPIVAGIILCAAALEQITVHPKAGLAAPFRWMLVGGLVSNLGGVAIAIGLAFRVTATERLAAAVAIAVLVAVSGELQGLTLLVLVDVALFVMLVAEHLRIEKPTGRNRTAGADTT
jgi:low temperature requirement protein LtrA